MTAFHVLPDPPFAPITVGPGTVSALLTFTELAGGAPATMWIRVARLGVADCSPTGGPDPGFLLSAGGSPATVALQPETVSIANAGGTIVARAAYVLDPLDVYRISVAVLRPGSSWTLRIRNDDTRPRRFTAVVADNDDDTGGARQPWINLPAAVVLRSDADTPAILTHTVTVPNYGTAALTVQPGGLDAPLLALPPDDIAPNSCGDLTIQYDPNQAGPRTQHYTVVSNDPSAAASTAHNNVITVSVDEDHTPPDPPPTIRPCQHNDGCTDFVPAPHDPEGACQRVMLGRTCGHPGAHHPAEFQR